MARRKRKQDVFPTKEDLKEALDILDVLDKFKFPPRLSIEEGDIIEEQIESVRQFVGNFSNVTYYLNRILDNLGAIIRTSETASTERVLSWVEEFEKNIWNAIRVTAATYHNADDTMTWREFKD